MKKDEPIKKQKVQESVAAGILDSFLNTLSEKDELKEVSDQLRDTMLVKRQFSETALHEALFGKKI